MKAVELLKGLLVTQINHFIIFIVGITVFDVSGSGESYIVQLALLGLLPFIFFLIRYFTDRAAAFAVLHILTAVAAAYLLIRPMWGNILPLVIFSLLITGYLVLSVVVRFTKEDKLEGQIHQLALVIIFAMMMLAQRLQGVGRLDRYFIAALIIYIGLHFIHLYILNFCGFFSKSDSVTGLVTERAIFKNGIKPVLLFTAVVVSVLLLFSQINTPPVSLPSINTTGEPPDITSGLPEPILPSEDSYNPRTLSSFWVNIGRIINVLLVAVILFLFIITFVRFLNRKNLIANIKKEQDPDLVVDVREKIITTKKKSDMGNLFRYFNPRERIRRIFKKRVLEGQTLLVGDRDRKLLNRFTSHEFKKALGDRVPASLYDKARYSNLECTAQDVKACKVK